MDFMRQTQVEERVSLATTLYQTARVFLGTAIGTGFISSSVAFAIFATSSVTVSPKAGLKAVNIESSRIVLEAGAEYHPLYFTLGTTLAWSQPTLTSPTDGSAASKDAVLKISTTNPQTTTNSNGPSEISAEPEPMDNQFVTLQYRKASTSRTLRIITICLGENTNGTVYVGSDGSTYLDDRLTQRTTVESCTKIKSRVLKMDNLVDMKVGSTGVWRDSVVAWQRSLARLGSFDGSVFTDGTTTSTAGNDPLSVTAIVEDGGELPASFALLTHQKALTLGSATATGQAPRFNKTVCLPATGVGFTSYYFDTSGSPYFDLFLRRRAMGGSCRDTLSRGLYATAITSATANQTVTDFGGWTFRNGRYEFGTANGTTWTPSNTSQIVPTRTVPLNVSPKPTDNGPATATIANTKFTLRYNRGKKVTLCFPGQASASTSTGQPRYFYDTRGRAYSDIFLTQRVTCPSVAANTNVTQ